MIEIKGKKLQPPKLNNFMDPIHISSLPTKAKKLYIFSYKKSANTSQTLDQVKNQIGHLYFIASKSSNWHKLTRGDSGQAARDLSPYQAKLLFVYDFVEFSEFCKNRGTKAIIITTKYMNYIVFEISKIEI